MDGIDSEYVDGTCVKSLNEYSRFYCNEDTILQYVYNENDS